MVGVDVSVRLHMEGPQLPAVPLGSELSLLGVRLTALVQVNSGCEEIDQSSAHAQTSFLW